jgi:tetrahydromethanopterin S-methyltransferase subunit E
MDLKKNIKGHWLKYLIGLITIVIIVLLWNREEIAENKYTKAKLEVFKALKNKDYDKAKSVIDSLK